MWRRHPSSTLYRHTEPSPRPTASAGRRTSSRPPCSLPSFLSIMHNQYAAQSMSMTCNHIRIMNCHRSQGLSLAFCQSDGTTLMHRPCLHSPLPGQHLCTGLACTHPCRPVSMPVPELEPLWGRCSTPVAMTIDSR